MKTSGKLMSIFFAGAIATINAGETSGIRRVMEQAACNGVAGMEMVFLDGRERCGLLKDMAIGADQIICDADARGPFLMCLTPKQLQSVGVGCRQTSSGAFDCTAKGEAMTWPFKNLLIVSHKVAAAMDIRPLTTNKTMLYEIPSEVADIDRLQSSLSKAATFDYTGLILDGAYDENTDSMQIAGIRFAASADAVEPREEDLIKVLRILRSRTAKRLDVFATNAGKAVYLRNLFMHVDRVLDFPEGISLSLDVTGMPGDWVISWNTKTGYTNLDSTSTVEIKTYLHSTQLPSRISSTKNKQRARKGMIMGEIKQYLYENDASADLIRNINGDLSIKTPGLQTIINEYAAIQSVAGKPSHSKTMEDLISILKNKELMHELKNRDLQMGESPQSRVMTFVQKYLTRSIYGDSEGFQRDWYLKNVDIEELVMGEETTCAAGAAGAACEGSAEMVPVSADVHQNVRYIGKGNFLVALLDAKNANVLTDDDYARALNHYNSQDHTAFGAFNIPKAVSASLKIIECDVPTTFIGDDGLVWGLCISQHCNVEFKTGHKVPISIDVSPHEKDHCRISMLAEAEA